MELEWFTLETKVHDSEDMCELRPAIPALSENFTFSGYGPTYVSDGSSIYAICGGPKRDDELPTTVYAVDYLESVCKSLQLMVMGAPRPASAVGIIQGKIYVLCVCGGSCVVQEYNIEGSDSDPPRWESFNIAFDENLEDICASFVMLNNIFIKVGWFSCVYNPIDRTLERYNPIDDHWFESSFKPSYCAIGKCLSMYWVEKWTPYMYLILFPKTGASSREWPERLTLVTSSEKS
ncbi:PREDICTED: uncharacterized protein LOC104729241 [Camelina sativa]|uniref:Uncharacterized protein LOC104729241 n=1 Tax=Camelina sativa TaxID=90675 RepID=A0ABM0UUA3_CAMSA|nr:PREDICTED: uncharacterized protein LOC104729241 [Camelina sativa]